MRYVVYRNSRNVLMSEVGMVYSISPPPMRWATRTFVGRTATSRTLISRPSRSFNNMKSPTFSLRREGGRGLSLELDREGGAAVGAGVGVAVGNGLGVAVGVAAGVGVASSRIGWSKKELDSGSGSVSFWVGIR